MKKVKFSWAYLLVLTLAIVCLFLLFTDTNVSGKKTTPDVAITMIQEDKVSDFYAKDGIAKIKLFDSQIKNFPTTADYYFKYTQDTISRVIDAIEKYGVEGKVIYACGPMPMLKALAAYAEEHGMEAQISLEERMACGIGACLACVCKSKEVDAHSQVHNKRVCKDGPVFLSTVVEL